MRKRVFLLISLLIPSLAVTGQVTGLAGWNICLDPGHSFKENMGIYGYSEAERNVRVALALRDLLLTQTDIDTVYLTRTNDQQNVSLSQRTDYANMVGAAWFHSIHSDASSSPSSKSTLLLWGQVKSLAEKVPPGGQSMSRHIVDLLTRGMRTTTSGSWGDWSFYTQWQNPSDPNFQGPWLFVNRNTQMPSELSESGFHTNPDQNQRFMNAEWKRLEAYTFFWSFLRFLGIDRPPVQICTGVVSDKDTGVPVNGATIEINGQNYITDTYSSLFHRFTNDPEKLHNGFYFLDNLQSGTWPVIVSAEGYYSDTLEVTLADTFFTFKDVPLISMIPPVVTNATPAEGADKFPAWNFIELTFSREMDPASVEMHLTLEPAAAYQTAWSDINRHLRLITDSLAFETDYTLTLSGNATDTYGHGFDGNGDGTGGDDWVLHFRTGPSDLAAPRLMELTPRRSAQQVEIAPVINAVFDEVVDSATVAPDMIRLTRNKDRSNIPGRLSHYIVGEQSVICFFPEEGLKYSESYTIEIKKGYGDRFGNIVNSSKVSTFITTPDSLTVTTIDAFEEGFTHSWWGPAQSGSTIGVLATQTGQAEDTTVVNLSTGGRISHRIDYGWDVTAPDWLIRIYLGGGDAQAVEFDNSGTLQVWVFGDGNGTLFRFCVDEQLPAAGSSLHEVSPWVAVDWLGWRLVSWNIAADGTGTWIGNGQVEGRLRMDSIQLSYNPGQLSTGTLYFDNLIFVQPAAVNAVSLPKSAPAGFLLYPNFPNPFNPETTLGFRLNAPSSQVELVIYDVLGRTVRTLINEMLPAGEHRVIWDSRDDSGAKVGSGIYVYCLTAGGRQQIRRMVLLK